MKSLKGSKTEQNIQFVVNTLEVTRKRNELYSKIARQEGYGEIADLFQTAAEQKDECLEKINEILRNVDQ